MKLSASPLAYFFILFGLMFFLPFFVIGQHPFQVANPVICTMKQFTNLFPEQRICITTSKKVDVVLYREEIANNDDFTHLHDKINYFVGRFTEKGDNR